MDLCIFDKFAVGNFLLHIVNRGKIVVFAIDLSFPWFSGRVGHRKSKLIVWKSLHEHFNEGSLTDTGWAAKDNGFGQARHGI
jgi:hypothetical protein